MRNNQDQQRCSSLGLEGAPSRIRKHIVFPNLSSRYQRLAGSCRVPYIPQIGSMASQMDAPDVVALRILVDNLAGVESHGSSLVPTAEAFASTCLGLAVLSLVPTAEAFASACLSLVPTAEVPAPAFVVHKFYRSCACSGLILALCLEYGLNDSLS